MNTSRSESETKLYAGYMFGRSDYTAPIKNYHGGVLQLDLMKNHRWGAAIDFSYARSNLDSWQWQMLFGPRAQFGGKTSNFGVTPWVGYGYIRRKVLNTANAPINHESGISYGIGGDWTLRLTNRFAYRVGADYLRPPFGQDKNSDWFRGTTGVVIKF